RSHAGDERAVRLERSSAAWTGPIDAMPNASAHAKARTVATRRRLVRRAGKAYVPARVVVVGCGECMRNYSAKHCSCQQEKVGLSWSLESVERRGRNFRRADKLSAPLFA